MRLGVELQSSQSPPKEVNSPFDSLAENFVRLDYRKKITSCDVTTVLVSVWIFEVGVGGDADVEIALRSRSTYPKKTTRAHIERLPSRLPHIVLFH